MPIEIANFSGLSQPLRTTICTGVDHGQDGGDDGGRGHGGGGDAEQDAVEAGGGGGGAVEDGGHDGLPGWKRRTGSLSAHAAEACEEGVAEHGADDDGLGGGRGTGVRFLLMVSMSASATTSAARA